MSPSELIAAIRKWPGMYVGNTDDASSLHHLLWELVANSLDEAVAGFGEQIEVVLHADDSVSVADGGRGFSMRLDEHRRSFIEGCLTEPHFTATRDGHRPHVHVSLLGVGLPVVSALSESLSIVTEREGRRWRVEVARGEITTPLEEVEPVGAHGTTVRVKPDPSVFSDTSFDHELICRRLSELAALRYSIRFLVRDERSGSESLIEHPEGLEALLSRGADDSTSVVRIETELPGGKLDAVLRWGRGESNVRSYAQLLETGEGGSHVRGFLRGLVQGAHWVDKRARSRAATRRALLDGIEAVLHVTLFDNPKYGGPTKNRIDDPVLEKAIYHAVKVAARDAFSSNRDVLAAILEKANPEAKE